MDLDRWLEKHQDIYRANGGFNGDILRFFSSAPIQDGRFRMIYERGPDFFDLLRARGEDSEVLVSRNPEGSVTGVTAATFRPGYINGRMETVGYLGDLRIGFDRRVLRTWKDSYQEYLNLTAPARPDGCKYFYTAVIDSNLRAMEALIRRSKGYTYRPLTHYRMVNVLLRKPWKRQEPVDWTIDSAPGIESLETFLSEQNGSLQFGYDFPKELSRRLKTWPGLTPNSFLAARQGDRILGCVAPWNPSTLKRIRVLEAKGPLTPVLRAAPRIFKRAPVLGGELKVSYLTHLHLDRKLARETRLAVFSTLLQASYEHALRDDPSTSFLAFPDFDEESLMEGARGFLTQEIPMTLYQVVADSWHGTYDLPPTPRIAFEMAIV